MPLRRFALGRWPRSENPVFCRRISMSIWKALLLVYRRIDVRIPTGRIRRKRFAHEPSEDELRDAIKLVCRFFVAR